MSANSTNTNPTQASNRSNPKTRSRIARNRSKNSSPDVDLVYVQVWGMPLGLVFVVVVFCSLLVFANFLRFQVVTQKPIFKGRTPLRGSMCACFLFPRKEAAWNAQSECAALDSHLRGRGRVLGAKFASSRDISLLARDCLRCILRWRSGP